MRLPAAQLVAATGCAPKNAEALAAALGKAMDGIIDTPMRAAHFLAQTAFESARYTAVEENLNYSSERLCLIFPRYFYLPPAASGSRRNALLYSRKPAEIANVVYANRLGNGAVVSGDGYRYRGRGFLQITGRVNYAALERDVPTLPCVEKPDLLCAMENAALSAAWFWKMAGCNTPADDNNVEAVTKRINGGTNGLAERRIATARALAALVRP